MKNLKVILLGIILVQVSLISAMNKKEPLRVLIDKEKQQEFNRFLNRIKKEVFNQTGLYSVLTDIIVDYSDLNVLIGNRILSQAAEALDYDLMCSAINSGVDIQGVKNAYNIISNIKSMYFGVETINRCDQMLKKLKEVQLSY